MFNNSVKAIYFSQKNLSAMAIAAPMQALPSSTNSTGIWYISWISRWSTWFLIRQAPEPTILVMPRSLSMSGVIIPARFPITPLQTLLVTSPRPMLPWQTSRKITTERMYSKSVFVLSARHFSVEQLVNWENEILCSYQSSDIKNTLNSEWKEVRYLF